jgi:hypothetical protein
MTEAGRLARPAWLLTRLRLRRMRNLTWSIFTTPLGRSRKRIATTATKSRSRVFVTGFVAFIMLFGAGNMGVQAYGLMERTLGPTLTQGLALQVLLLLAAALFITLGNKSLSKPEWDLEWLVTLPVERGALLSSRLVERTFSNPAALIILWPFLTVLAWKHGFRWTAPLVALVAAVPLFAVLAVLQTVVDTALRLAWSPARLRNLQGALGLLAGISFYVALSAATTPHSPVIKLAAWVPAWSMWLPTGLVVQALSTHGSAQLADFAMLVTEVALLFTAGAWLIQRQLRFGVVAAGVREAGGRGLPRVAEPTDASPSGLGSFLTPVQRRELRLVARDRNYLIQTLVLPIFVVSVQYFLRGETNIFALSSNAAHVAAIAFGISAYALMFSAFQTLNSEGGALWILYTLPQQIATVLRQKAMLWICVTLVYPVVIFSVAVTREGGLTLEWLGLAVIVLVGVAIYALMALALGIFGSNPLAQEVRQRANPTYTYLYFLLSSLYVYAIYARTFWEKLAMMILSGSLALALWQKAKDELPYLLDPSAAPPSRVSLSDGLIAALLFFVVQALVALFLAIPFAEISGPRVLVAFVVAGAATYGLMRLSFWRSHTTGVPRLLAPGVLRAVALAVAVGALAAALGVVYLRVVVAMDLVPKQGTRIPEVVTSLRWWFFGLAVIAAPLFEEFIFRGLVFGGLRRITTPFAAAAASAALFAIVHPPISAMPVFVLGLFAALVYERTRMLLAPMIVHGVYNATLLAYQWNSTLQLT